MAIGRTGGAGQGIRIYSDGIVGAIAAVNFIPSAVEKNVQQSAARQVGHVVERAKEFFYADIKRPAAPQTDGSRMTGSFTFGQGGAFVGRTYKMKGGKGYGFGFPDIRQADTQTRFVWRSLEHGLQGTRASSLKGISSPSSLGLFFLPPRGTHVLPSRYQWSDGMGKQTVASGTAHLMITKNSPKRDRRGSGIEGKHFIERAWLQQIPFIEKRFKRALDDALIEALKK